MARTLFHRSAIAAALFAAAGAPAPAAPPSTTTGGETIILKPLTLLKIEDLDFGILFPSGAAGTATLDPLTDGVTVAGGITAGSRPTTAAEFTGAGTRKAPVILRVPTGPVTLTRVGGTETMTVTNFTLDGPQTRHITPFEAYSFKVGGRLNVGANQVDGVYEGTFTVTATYQ